MHCTADYSMHHYAGFLQIGLHIFIPTALIENTDLVKFSSLSMQRSATIYYIRSTTYKVN